MPDGVIALRRGSIPRVPCDTRYLNPASCYRDFVQRVTWDGEVQPLRALSRPRRVTYWASFTPTPDGSLWAVGVGSRNRGMVGRYGPDATEPELTSLGSRINVGANIVAVAGGVAVFPTDGSAWLSRGGSMQFERAGATPRTVVLHTGHGGASRGVEATGLGTLSIFGSEDFGWTSRFSPPEGEDILQRMIDAHSRVRAIPNLRALHSGKTVALLQRFHEAPDAVAITTDFGRSWLSAAEEDAAGEQDGAEEATTAQ